MTVIVSVVYLTSLEFEWVFGQSTGLKLAAKLVVRANKDPTSSFQSFISIQKAKNERKMLIFTQIISRSYR